MGSLVKHPNHPVQSLRNLSIQKVKMDVGWGVVPRMSLSDTALRYINENVRVREEADLPAGGHLRCRRIMEEELRGYKQGKVDLVEQDDDYLAKIKRMTKKSVGNSEKIPMSSVYNNWTRIGKPGAGLGWTEPRMEEFVGLVDRRKHMRGYVGGVRKRDCKFGK